MTTRTCSHGHPVSLLDTTCQVCGEELTAPDPADAPEATDVGGGGWGHILVGLGLGIMASIIRLGTDDLGSPLGFLAVGIGALGAVVLAIGIVAEGIKVSRGP